MKTGNACISHHVHIVLHNGKICPCWAQMNRWHWDMHTLDLSHGDSEGWDTGNREDNVLTSNASNSFTELLTRQILELWSILPTERDMPSSTLRQPVVLQSLRSGSMTSMTHSKKKRDLKEKYWGKFRTEILWLKHPTRLPQMSYKNAISHGILGRL